MFFDHSESRACEGAAFSFWNADLFKMEGFASSRNFMPKA